MAENTVSKEDIPPVKENGWTKKPISSKFKNNLNVLIIVLKFVSFGLLTAALVLQYRSLYVSNWVYDHYVDTTYHYDAKIYHDMWGFHDVAGASFRGFSPFVQITDPEWQSWKKPIIKLVSISVALGTAASLIQVVPIALNFLHPKSAIKIALLVAVVILSEGAGGLMVKTILDFPLDRPVIGIKASLLTASSSHTLTIVRQEGYYQAISSAAMLCVAGVLALVTIVLTIVKEPIIRKTVTPINDGSGSLPPHAHSLPMQKSDP